jgi:hypothetical protein
VALANLPTLMIGSWVAPVRVVPGSSRRVQGELLLHLVEPVRESALITLVDTAIGSAARHELLTRTEALNLLDGVRRAVRDTASEPAVASIVNTALVESAGQPTLDRRRVLDALLDIRRIASTLPVDYSKGSSD